MRKTVIILFLFFVTASFSQSIYKGLEYGMSKKEAVEAFRADRDTYITVDIGNGFLYRIYQQNFIYNDDKLVGVWFTPKGTAMGMGYDTARNYLIHTRSFFQDLGYSPFIENEYWDAPQYYDASASKWGLVLVNEEKTRAVQMFPTKTTAYGRDLWMVQLKVWHYDTWMGYFEAENAKQEEIKKKSGF